MSEFSEEIQRSAELFRNLILKRRQSIWDFFKDKGKDYEAFDDAMKNYVGSLIKSYNAVQVLGMREPVPLKNLFVRVNILEKITARTGLSLEDLATFFDFDRRSFGTKKETVDGEVIINKLQQFIVLGKPGAGKTTYLKFLTLMMLDKNSQIKKRRLPIFVTLRAWADEPMPLIDFIVRDFIACGFNETKDFVKQMLQNGECLVLFDGLDEVSETAKQDEIIRQIKKIAEQYTKNQFVISCRVAAYNHWFEGFTEVEMADFNEEQMGTFIRNWFHNESKVASECWERLKNNPPLLELASVPLLLTLLCLEYGESNNFPPNRAELYHRAIETLLTKWDSSRRIRRPEVYKKLTIKQKKSMFARIAWGTFKENIYFIREMELSKMIEKFIEHLPGFKEEDLEPDSMAILKAIEAQHGIFVERAKGVYSFAHLTFQEYFIARYISDNVREGMLENLVEQHLFDPKWKEVFLLTAGLLDSADELLLLMRRRVEKMLEIAEVNALMAAVEKSLWPYQNKYPLVIQRSFAVFIALALGLDLALDLAMANANILARNQPRKLAIDSIRTLDSAFSRALKNSLSLSLALDNALGTTLIIALKNTLARAFGRSLDIAIEHEIIIDLAIDLARTRTHYLAQSRDLGIDLNIIPLEAYCKINKLNEQLALKIPNYLYANTLIVSCLEAANYVSKDVREKMLHEVCLPKKG